ncbi:unnamed protein product [Calypogeia fissa]
MAAAHTGPRSWADSLMVGGVKVKPTARTLVVPSKPTPEQWLRLSNLDRVVNPTFSSSILFYTRLLVRPNRTFEEIVQSLKESLANVLVDFFPLAGRLALRDDGLVDLHCGDQGAVFVEAMVDADLDDLGGAQPMSALSGLEAARLGPGPLYIPDQLKPMPALVVQVTRFRACGSVAIAVNWHHTVADGSSGCHFMKSWSEVAMGRALSLKPDHNRDQLTPRFPLNSSLVNKGYSTRNVQELQRLANPKLLPTAPPVLKLFPISQQAVLDLKAEAKTEDSVFTSAESVSGHLWKVTTKARRECAQEDPDDHEIMVGRKRRTRFFMFVDGRKRLKLSPGYFGNVVCSACAEATEEEIMARPVSYAADLIRKAVRNVSGEYFRSLIDWVEEQGRGQSKSEHVNSLGHDVAATFWTSFPLYQMDFGWGNPSFATRNSGPRPLIDGIAMMPSPEGPGNMVAILNLHADRMKRVENDAGFLKAGVMSDSSGNSSGIPIDVSHQLQQQLQRIGMPRAY